MKTDKRIIRLGGLYNQVTRWGVYSQKGICPTITASMGGGWTYPYDNDKGNQWKKY